MAGDAWNLDRTMSRVAWLLAVVAALLALAVWQRDAVRGQLQALGLPLPGWTAAAPPLPGRSGRTPRKCVAGDSAVVYTDERCPAGHRELAVDGGSLSVLPATRAAPAAAAPAASAKPLLRQWAPDADGPTIKERMADRLP